MPSPPSNQCCSELSGVRVSGQSTFRSAGIEGDFELMGYTADNYPWFRYDPPNRCGNDYLVKFGYHWVFCAEDLLQCILAAGVTTGGLGGADQFEAAGCGHLRTRVWMISKRRNPNLSRCPEDVTKWRERSITYQGACAYQAFPVNHDASLACLGATT